MTKIGTAIAVIGYGLAIAGGWMLYKNAVPDTYGQIPATREGEDSTTMWARVNGEKAQRACNTKIGFGLLTLGSFLQLVGTAVAGFLS